MPRLHTEAPGGAIKRGGAVAKASIGDERKTTTHYGTMMIGYEMAAAVHCRSRLHRRRYQKYERRSEGRNCSQMTHGDRSQ